MKSVVYKYLIPFQEGFTFNLPVGSKVVRIDVDQGNPYMWVLVPLEETKVVKYHFKSSKTGGVIEHENDLVFIDTYAIFIQMELMLYVFLEKITTEEDLLLANPFFGEETNYKGIRRVLILRNFSLFYAIEENSKEIRMITFRDNRKNPKF